MPDSLLPLISDHPRQWRENRFVYPVVSRRSHGISVGINLNPDKVCNFDCVYCQVDRRSEAETRFVATEQLLVELESTLRIVGSGSLFQDEKFRQTPSAMRRLNDIAFSGDGEPTTFRNFDEIVDAVADVRQRHDLLETKLVLITNASMFHRPVVQRGLKLLDANNGEIWAKLDAGTDQYYQTIERTRIPFRQVLDNIAAAARVRPIVIQSLWLKLNDEPPTDAEIDAYAERLAEIVATGGTISCVQIYTVARPPAESSVTALTAGELQRLADRVRYRVNLPLKVFPGNR